MGSQSVFLYKKKLKSGVFWYARIPKEYGTGYITRSTRIHASDSGRSYVEAFHKAEQLAEDLCTSTSPIFLDYIRDFWTIGSDYLQHKSLVLKKPVSPAYIALNTMN
jgi:hypothetical protein